MVSSRVVLMACLLAALCPPFGESSTNAGQCAARQSIQTALLLQKKGPEAVILEIDPSTGKSTGLLRSSLKLHGSTFSGFAANDFDRLYFIPSVAPLNIASLDLKKADQGVLNNVGLNYSDTSLGNVANVWNVAPWEGQGKLFAVTPAPDFHTWLLSIHAATGKIDLLRAVGGVPVRGIFADDRRGDRYWFVVSKSPRPALVTYLGATNQTQVAEFGPDFSTLVGIHYDSTRCILIGFFLRAPGLLSMRSVEVEGGMVVLSEELNALSPAASSSAQALELIGMTSLVSGVTGPMLMVRDPLSSSVRAFNIWGGSDVSFSVEDVVGIAPRTLLRPLLTSVYPKTVGMTGFAKVTIVGSDFGFRDSSPSVTFGGVASTQVTWVSETMMTALVPATTSLIPVEILSEVAQGVWVTIGGTAATAASPLDVHYVLSWHTVHPSRGVVLGGTRITLSGGRFSQGVSYSCRFGGVISAVATRVNDFTATCITPAWPSPAGEIVLDLVVDGAPVHKDGRGVFVYAAGQAMKMTLVGNPGYLLGGLVPEVPFSVAIQDQAGNNVLDSSNAVDLTVREGSFSGQMVLTRAGVQAVDGIAVFDKVAINRADNYSFTFKTSGLPDIYFNISVYVGQASAITVVIPDMVVASLAVYPHPVVKVVDAGGNLVNVNWNVSASLVSSGEERFQASRVVLAAGQASFHDLTFFKSGVFAVRFSAGGISAEPVVEVVPSSPAHVYNSVMMPAGHHQAMKPLTPFPRVIILDSAYNHIREKYWTQWRNGSLAYHYLDVWIEAKLVTAFSDVSPFSDVSFSDVSPQLSDPAFPSVYPAGVNSWNYRLNGIIKIRLVSDPAGTVDECPANCSSRGECHDGHCTCPSGWEGVACERPSEAVLCRAEGCVSSLSFFLNENCICQDVADVVFSVKQVGVSANFTDLVVDRKAGGYVLMFSSTGLLPSRSMAFSVIAGDATHLGLISQPYGNSKPLGGYGGVGLVNAPLVEVRDGGGNLVWGDTQVRLVKVQLVERGNGAVLVGINATNAYKGLATFDKVAVDLVGQDYQLVFTCGDLLPVTSDSFTVTYGSPHSIALIVQPGRAFGGEALVQQPEIEVRDAGGNRVLNASISVTANLIVPSVMNTATISGGSNPVLSAAGLAVFTDLAVDLVGSGYSFELSSAGLPKITSHEFDVGQGRAWTIEVLEQPGNASGGFLGIQPSVRIFDQGGNYISDSQQSINVFFVNSTLLFDPVNFAGSGWSSGGIVSFTDVAVGPAGSNFSLVFQSGSRTNAPLFYSMPFDIVVGPPSQFSFLQQPSNSWAGDEFSIQPFVVLHDAGGNIVLVSHGVQAVLDVPNPLQRTLDSAFATSLPKSAYTGDGCKTTYDAPVLSGKDILWSDSMGIVRFTNLSINVPAPGYMLSFVSLSNLVTGATSDSFAIRLAPGQADIIRVVCTPGNESAAEAFVQQPVIEFVDKGGNQRHVVSATRTVTVSLVSLAGVNATLSGNFKSVAYGDLVTFTNLAIDKAGSGFILKFSSPQLTSGYSHPFTVIATESTALSVRSFFRDVMTDRRQRYVEGGEEFRLDVLIVDKGGNIVLGDNRYVSIQLWTNANVTRKFSCTGEQECTTYLDASVPAGSRLVSATASIDVRCTDLDAPSEYLEQVTIASATLKQSEFNSGPWPGCTRSCSTMRNIVANYDIVKDLCWSTDDTACSRLIVSDAWDAAAQTSWEFFQSTAAQKNDKVPVIIKATPDVNFYPCDGYFISAEISLVVEYAMPSNGGAQGNLSGNTTVAAVDGVASFTDLSIGKAGNRYTLKTSSTGMVSTLTFPFPAIPGPVDSVGIITQPGNGSGNSTLLVGTVVDLFDSVMNRVNRSDAVTATLIIDDLEGGLSAATQGLLKGTTRVFAENGRASFTDLAVGIVSTGIAYRLNITSGMAEPALTDRFYVVAGPPYRIGLYQQPGDSFGGSPLTTQPIAAPQDWSGNIVAFNDGTVTVAIGKNGGVVGVLSGTKTAAMVNNRASFNDLSIDKIGQGYTLLFSFIGLARGESESFDVVTGDAAKLTVIRQPKRSTVMQLLTAPQPAVAVTDIGGNIIADWEGNVTVSIYQQGKAPHPSLAVDPATLLGTTLGYRYEGVFYFWNLKIDQVGIDIVLEFTSDPVFPAAWSNPFSVYGMPAAALVVISQPSMTKASLTLPPVLVAAVDVNGDVDFSFSRPVSVAVGSVPMSNSPVSFTVTQDVKFVAGIASFTDLAVAQTGRFSLNMTAMGVAHTLSKPFEVIDAWTGWWRLNWPRPAATFSFFMRRVKATIEARWTILSDKYTYVSKGAPYAKAASSCQYSVGQVRKNGVGAGSFLLDNCAEDTVNITSAVQTNISPQTTWAKDVEYFKVEESYPEVRTRHYVAVANSFDGTSYTTDSVLYEWVDGDLVQVRPVPFTGTKGAHSLKHFVMGGAHFVIVANHYDDAGNGYGVPSIIYRLGYSVQLNRNIFTPIQSISTSGAAAWETFEIGEETFLAVANYFNGSHFDINSKIFKLARTNPDTPLPRIESVQAIPTSGARCVEAFEISGTQYLAFGNRWGGTIKVYRWDLPTQHFAWFRTIVSLGVLSIDSFKMQGKTYLAVANLADGAPASGSSPSAVYFFDSQTFNFVRLQTLPTGGSSDIKHFVHGDSHFLAVANVHDAKMSNGSSEVYRWDGSVFAQMFDLPSLHAYSLAIFNVPCETTGSDGITCGARTSEDIIVAANGWGVSSAVFQIMGLSITLEATHVETIGDSPASALVNTVLAPSTSAALKKLGEDATSEFADERFVSVEAEVFQEHAPVGIALRVPRSEKLLGLDSLVLGANGTVTFDGLSLKVAGNMSLRVKDDYLANVTASLSKRFELMPRDPVVLGVSFVTSILNSSEPIYIAVTAQDEFGNFQPGAADATVEATIDGDDTIKVSGGSAVLRGGVAYFPNISLAGIHTSIRFKFVSTGYASAYSTRFDVAAPTFLQQGTIGDNMPIIAGATATSPGFGSIMYVFGGLDPVTGPTNKLYTIDSSTIPFTVSLLTASARRRQLLGVTSSQAPPPRYDHVALVTKMAGKSKLMIVGGRNATMATSGLYALDLSSLTWTSLGTDSGLARSKHSAVVGVPTSSGAPSFDGSTTMVVFGGKSFGGKALGDVRTYRVLSSQVLFAGNPVKKFGGDVASARWGAVMAWVANRAYILGGFDENGDLKDEELYSFTLDYNIIALKYEITWAAKVRPDALPGFRPPTPLSSAPALVDGRIYLIAPSTDDPDRVKVYVLNPASKLWQPTLDAGSVAGAASIYSTMLVPVAPGKVAIFLSTEGKNVSNSLMLSFSPSYKLGIASGLPTGAKAGKVLTPTQAVAILDESGAKLATDMTTQVTATASNALGDVIPLSGMTTVTAVDGVARFTTLAIDRNGTGLVLKFSSPALFPASTAAFPVGPGPVAKIIFLQIPAGVLAGSEFSIQPKVKIVDVAGNLVASDSTSTLTAKLEKYEGGTAWSSQTSLLNGHTSIMAVAGYVTFTDLGIDASASPGFIFRFLVTRSGVTPAITANFTFTSSAETNLVFNTISKSYIPATNSCFAFAGVDFVTCNSYRPPGLTAFAPVVFAGVPFKDQPTLIFELKVSPGLLLAAFGGVQVTATLVDSLTGVPVANAMVGTTEVVAANGLAIFTDLRVMRAGGDYKVRFESPGMADKFSVAFRATPGPPDEVKALISIEPQPLAGTNFVRQPSVVVLDAGGNEVTKSVEVVAKVVSPSGTAVVDGNFKVKTTKGKAFFTDLSINEPGTGFQLVFTVRDPCCAVARNATSDPFDVIVGEAYQLEERVPPANATGGKPFSTQPVVRVLDAGGNVLVNYKDTIVTAEIGQDNTLFFSVADKDLAVAGSDILDIEPFVFGNKQYFVIARFFDGKTYLVNSSLYMWNETTEKMAFVQELPSLAAWDWHHFETPQGEVYLVVANSFREVTSDGGVPLGTFKTQSFLFKFVDGVIKYASSFDTKGATSIESFVIGSTTIIGVTNSYDDSSHAVPSQLFRLVDKSDPTFGLSVVLEPFQQVQSTSAHDMQYLFVGKERYLAVANNFGSTSYTANSTVYKYIEGKFVAWKSVVTYAAMSVKSFKLEHRTFLVFASALTSSLSVLDGGTIDVYELEQSGLVLRQSIAGLHGVNAITHFRLNQADWIAVATTPHASVDVQGGLLLNVWNTSICADASSCDVNFTVYKKELASGVQSVAYFRGMTSSFVVFAGSVGGIKVAKFSSLAGFTGNTKALFVNGLATFTDLGISLAQSSYRIRYTAPGLLPADGAAFAVTVGAAFKLQMTTLPRGALGGSAFAVQPVLRVLDIGENIVTDTTLQVTAAVLGEEYLGGMRVADIRGGVASFTDLSINEARQVAITLRFFATGLVDQQVDIVVKRGPPYKLETMTEPSGAFGGTAFATQPKLRVLDRGGNFLNDHNGTVVDVVLGEGGVVLDAASTYASTGGTYQAKSFPANGKSFVVLRNNDTDNVVLQEWACKTLQTVQNVSVTGAWDIELWHAYGKVWLAAAAPAGLAMFVFDDKLETFVGVSLPSAVEASCVRAHGKMGQRLAVGRSERSPFSHAAGGFQIFSWDGQNMTSIQDVTAGAGDTIQMEHAEIISYNGGTRDLLVRSYYDVGATTSITMGFYLWDMEAEGYLPYDEASPSEPWLSGGGTYPEHLYYPSFPVFSRGGLRHFDLITDLEHFDLSRNRSKFYGGRFAITVSTDQVNDETGLILFGDDAMGDEDFFNLTSAGAFSSVYFRQESLPYIAFRTPGGLNVYDLLNSLYITYTYILESPNVASPLTYTRLMGESALLVPTESSLEVVKLFEGPATLAGVTTASSINGVATFTDLSIDVAKVGPFAYTLMFGPASLRAQYATLRDYELHLVTQDLVEVRVGSASAMRINSADVATEGLVVAVVDAGGNIVTTDTSTVAEANLIEPNVVSTDFRSDFDPFSTTGAKRVTHFTVGSLAFVAVANQYDGSVYNIDSAIYLIDSASNPLTFTQYQQIFTFGAYGFTAFELPLTNTTKLPLTNTTKLPLTNTTKASFLAVANHYHDQDGYVTNSMIYRWDGTRFIEHASVPTYGAAHWESFTIDSQHYLIVANFFDGTFHSVNSSIYKWSWNGRDWVLGNQPVQELPTVAAHHIAFFSHAGESYLAVAQQWDEKSTSFALASVVYKWSRFKSKFVAIGTLPSQGALHIEPFVIGGKQYLAVANSLNALTGKPEVTSVIYELGCTDGKDVFSPIQSIPTSGATSWHHFVRGGIHHMAVTHWVPQNISKVVFYVWTGSEFVLYVELANDGAFDVAVIRDGRQYYFVETLPGDSASRIKMLSVDNATSVTAVNGILDFGTLAETHGADVFSPRLEPTGVAPSFNYWP